MADVVSGGGDEYVAVTTALVTVWTELIVTLPAPFANVPTAVMVIGAVSDPVPPLEASVDPTCGVLEQPVSTSEFELVAVPLVQVASIRMASFHAF